MQPFWPAQFTNRNAKIRKRESVQVKAEVL
jgi:hypothetical protein